MGLRLTRQLPHSKNLPVSSSSISSGPTTSILSSVATPPSENPLEQQQHPNPHQHHHHPTAVTAHQGKESQEGLPQQQQQQQHSNILEIAADPSVPTNSTEMIQQATMVMYEDEGGTVGGSNNRSHGESNASENQEAEGHDNLMSVDPIGSLDAQGDHGQV